MPWQDVMSLLRRYAHMENRHDTGFYHVARIKQWLHYLQKEYEKATALFQHIKTCHNADELRLRIADFKE